MKDYQLLILTGAILAAGGQNIAAIPFWLSATWILVEEKFK